MKIAYVNYSRIPTEKAHGFQIVKMCEAFARNGNEVTLIIPKRKNEILEDLFSYYNIPQDVFTVRQIDVGEFDLYHAHKLVIAIKNTFYSFRYLFRLNRQEIPEGALVYTRNATIAWWIGFRFPELTLIYEAHGVPKYFFFHRWLLQKVKFVVAITQGIVDDYRERGYSGRMIVEPDAVDLSLFSNMKCRQEIRRELGLPLEDFLVVYTGSFSLYSWKGVDTLIAAATYLPKKIRVVLVGGTPEEISRMKDTVDKEQVLFVPRVGRELVSKYLCAADLLALPNSKGDIMSERYTSPLKLFEYMASGTPIISSDLPSLREMLSTENAFLIQANDPRALAEGIRDALQHKEEATARAQVARTLVQCHTWQLRAKRVIDAIN